MPDKVPPFIDENAERVAREMRQSVRSNMIMASGWFLLTLALLAGVKLTYDHLVIVPKPENYSIGAPVLIIIIAYLSGWVLSLVSIRSLHNQVMPLIVKLYTVGVLAGILFVYFRAVYKIFIFPAGGENHLLPSNTHFFLLIVGYLTLVSLSVLVHNFYLWPHAIALLVAIGAHITLAVLHYVFLDVRQGGPINYDLYYMLTILVMAVLLSSRYKFLRQLLVLNLNINPNI